MRPAHMIAPAKQRVAANAAAAEIVMACSQNGTFNKEGLLREWRASAALHPEMDRSDRFLCAGSSVCSRELGGNQVEDLLELRLNEGKAADDRNGDKACDEPVFDSGSAGFILDE